MVALGIRNELDMTSNMGRETHLMPVSWEEAWDNWVEVEKGKWERILFSNQYSGAVELVMDPSNPRILYASTWRLNRTPYSLNSGGEGSALWKSIEEGKN